MCAPGAPFAGTLPPELLHLDKLDIFDLSKNDWISGTLPNEGWGNLSRLTHLGLDDNKISGDSTSPQLLHER